MTSFKEFWEVAAFRDAFSTLIELPDSSIAAVRTGLDEDALPSASPEPSISADVWTKARAVIQTLLSVRDDEGFTALLDDVQQVVRGVPDRERAVAVVRQLFEIDPQTEQANLLRRTQYSALPVLMDLSVEVDFRVAALKESENASLVPLFIVRMTFDENIAGSDAIVFQVPEAQTSMVLRRLDEARALRASIIRRLPEGLVHDQIRRELLGDDKGEA